MTNVENRILRHVPWSLIGVTAPFFLQSTVAGILVTLSYLNDVSVGDHTLCSFFWPLISKALNSSLWRSANRLMLRLKDLSPAALKDSMNCKLFLNIWNRFSLSVASLYTLPCCAIHFSCLSDNKASGNLRHTTWQFHEVKTRKKTKT